MSVRWDKQKNSLATTWVHCRVELVTPFRGMRSTITPTYRSRLICKDALKNVSKQVHTHCNPVSDSICVACHTWIIFFLSVTHALKPSSNYVGSHMRFHTQAANWLWLLTGFTGCLMSDRAIGIVFCRTDARPRWATNCTLPKRRWGSPAAHCSSGHPRTLVDPSETSSEALGQLLATSSVEHAGKCRKLAGGKHSGNLSTSGECVAAAR